MDDADVEFEGEPAAATASAAVALFGLEGRDAELENEMQNKRKRMLNRISILCVVLHRVTFCEETSCEKMPASANE